jgi:outer membrane protein assembly factor BamC
VTAAAGAAALFRKTAYVRVHSCARPPGVALFLGAALALGGCTSLSSMTSGDRIDYRTAGGSKTAGLDVPPDLTQLTRDSRFQQSTGTVSASAYQAAVPAAAQQAPALANVALSAAGGVRLERLGNERFLVASIAPEQLWPQLRAFWQERGFTLVVDEAPTGTMETQWAENRAKLPLDFIRGAVGRALDNLYSTGERDKFRTRVERTAGGGSEIYISHRGMVEVYSDMQKTQTIWQPRPSDPQLEAEFLSRLMIKLGAKEEQAKAAVVATAPAAAAAAPARARLLEGRPAATLQVDDGFDRAWRRVGLALDRSGFTVEDRDRSQGQYFVRYVDPARAGREEPGFFGRLFSFGSKAGNDAGNPARYRVNVKSEGPSTIVSVLNGQGAPENGEAGQRIVRLLVEDLK